MKSPMRFVARARRRDCRPRGRGTAAARRRCRPALAAARCRRRRRARHRGRELGPARRGACHRRLRRSARAIAVAKVGAAAVGALAEKPELFGRLLILVGLAEGIAIYGLIVSILILNRLG